MLSNHLNHSRIRESNQSERIKKIEDRPNRTCIVETAHGESIKTVAVDGFEPTSNWQDLFGIDYPSVEITGCVVGDIIEVSGFLVCDKISGYANDSDVYRYCVRQTNTNNQAVQFIHPASVSAISWTSGDVSAAGPFYCRAEVTAATATIFVGLQYKAANTSSRSMVANERGAVSSLYVRRLSPITIPTV